jgi:diguanylate cyclase (GGDEF)-like protein/PAS domain S-box-containing protein
MPKDTSCTDSGSRIEALEKELAECRHEMESLKTYKERYRALFKQSLDAVFVMDLEGNLLDGNAKSLEMVGYSPAGENTPKNILEVVDPDQIDQFARHMNDIIKEGQQKGLGEFKIRRPDGSFVHVETSASGIYRNDKISAIQVVSRDVTSRRHAEEDLKQKWDALKNAPIGIYVAQNGKFVWVNQRFITETGHRGNELMGMEAMDLVIPDDRALLKENMVRMLKGQSHHPFEYRTIHPNTDKERWVRGEAVSIIFNDQRAVLGYYSDIDILMMQNITDSLTGLHNRRYVLERAEQLVETANRYGHPLSIIMLDVDHFKHYNDELGHVEGDKALAKIGEIVKNATRRVDVSGRYGGEEFCVVLPNTSIDYGLEVAQRIKNFVEKKTIPPNLAKPVTVSLGLAEMKKNRSLTELIKDADEKLYAAKSAGRNRVVF